MKTNSKNQGILDALTFAYNVITVPAVIFHEFCHWIAGILLYGKLGRVKFGINDISKFSHWARVEGNLFNNKIKDRIVYVAPAIGTILLLSFFPNWYVLSYVLITPHMFLPSKHDLVCAMYPDHYRDLIEQLWFNPSAYTGQPYEFVLRYKKYTDATGTKPGSPEIQNGKLFDLIEEYENSL